jgi:hypothetical protein
VYNITTGEIYASGLDAASALGIDPSCVSAALTGKSKTCKGMRLCLVSKIMENLEEITEQNRIRLEKVTAYDTMIAEQEAKQNALKKVEKHEQNCIDIRLQIVELNKKLEEEGKRLNAARDAYNDLTTVNN